MPDRESATAYRTKRERSFVFPVNLLAG
ncbi:MAG: hypothetical protein QOH53_1551, partial [Ilumatobacteraceae bacterium]